MKKAWVVFMLSGLFVAGSFGLDLTLQTGQKFENVGILNQSNNGVIISSVLPDQSVLIRRVRFNNLTPDSLRDLRKYLLWSQMNAGKSPGGVTVVPGNVPQYRVPGTNITFFNGSSNNTPLILPQQANRNGMSQSVQNMPDNVLTLDENISVTPITPNLPVQSNFLNPNAPNSPIILPGFPYMISFESITQLGNGSFGWMKEFDYGRTDPDNATNFGRVYIYGIFVPNGGSWVGRVYPTTKQIMHRGQYYPCYATSPGMARRINASVP